MVGELLAEKDEVARGEPADVVADEPGPLPLGEERQLHRDVIVPVLPLAVDGDALAGPDDHVDLAQGLPPPQDAERMPAGGMDRLAVTSHVAKASHVELLRFW